VLRIAIGDGDRTYIAALASLIIDEADIAYVGSAQLASGLASLVVHSAVDIVAVDVGLPEGGIQGVADRLRDAGSACRLVALASTITPTARAAATAAGAETLIAKAEAIQLLAALTTRGG